MSEFIERGSLRGVVGGVDQMPVEATPAIPDTGNWTPEAGEVAEVQVGLQVLLRSAFSSVTADAESAYPAAGVLARQRNDDGSESGANVDFLDLLEARQRNFEPTGGGDPDMDQVRAYVGEMYGEVGGRSLIQTINSIAEQMDLPGSGFGLLVTNTVGTPALTEIQRRVLLRDTLYHFVASSSPTAVRGILRGLVRGDIALVRNPGGVRADMPSETRRFIRSLDTICNLHRAAIPAEIPAAVLNHVIDPNNAALRTALHNHIGVDAAGEPNRFLVHRTGAPLPLNDAQVLKDWISPNDTPLYKGADTLFQGVACGVAPGIRDQLAALCRENSTDTPATLATRLTALRELASSSRAQATTGGKYREIHTRITNPAFLARLGQGTSSDLSQTIEANLNAESPLRKEVLARRAFDQMASALTANPLVEPNTPWGESWTQALAQGRNALTNVPPDLMRALDMLGRIQVFMEPHPAKALAVSSLSGILGTSILSRGPEGATLARALEGAPDANFGTQSYDYLFGAPPGLAGNRAVAVVRQAEMLSNIQRNMRNGAALAQRAITTPPTISIEDNARRIAAMTYLTSVPGANILNFNFAEGREDNTTGELTQDMLAELLGLPPGGPEVQQILSLTSPDRILNAQQNRFQRILEQLRARRGALGMAVAGAVLTLGFSIPAMVPVAAAAGVVFAGVTAVTALRNFVGRIRRNRPTTGRLQILRGVGRTFAEMGGGAIEAVRFGLRRENLPYFLTAGILSYGLRTLLPGWGTVIALGAEAAVAVGSEIHLSRRQADLATNVAAIRSLLDPATPARNVTYTNSAGANVTESVRIAEYYGYFRVEQQNIRHRLEAVAQAAGRDLTDAERDQFADAGVIASLRAPGRGNQERAAAAVMEQVMIPAREAVQQSTEGYYNLARIYSSVLAGSAVGGIAFGATRFAEKIVQFEQRFTSPGERPATPTAPTSSAPAAADAPGTGEERYLRAWEGGTHYGAPGTEAPPVLPTELSADGGHFNFPEYFSELERTRNWGGTSLRILPEFFNNPSLPIPAGNDIAAQSAALGQLVNYANAHNIDLSAALEGGQGQYLQYGIHNLIKEVMGGTSPSEAILSASAERVGQQGASLTSILAQFPKS